MKEDPLLKLEHFGQSIWMDFIRREMIASDELKQLIEEDGLGGVTSNPSIISFIFQQLSKTDFHLHLFCEPLICNYPLFYSESC